MGEGRVGWIKKKKSRKEGFREERSAGFVCKCVTRFSFVCKLDFSQGIKTTFPALFFKFHTEFAIRTSIFN